MIPIDYITEWSSQMPWKTNEQVEQDLVISRSLVELFSDSFLASSLSFRGGTALNKLYLNPPLRYSEDIDLVQISAKPFGPVIDRIRERLAFLGEPQRKQKANNNTLYYRFESEFPPVQRLRLKVETNCREHFSVLGLQKIPFQIQSSYFEGKCDITTYRLEELLGTKLRALYQRSKGRDLYDLYKALTKIPELSAEDLINCYHEYMKHSDGQPPSQRQFLLNIENKMLDPEFLGDTTALLRQGEFYNPQEAFELVKAKLILKI
jgi:predicted nucleotidyltransferase component of viral defense system